MELQQPNPSVSTPNGYTKLLADEVNSSAQSLLPQEKLQETSSSVHQRTSTSIQDASNSSETPQNPPIKNRIKELDGCFGTFYKVLMVIFILMPGLNVISSIFLAITGLEFDKFFLFVEGWGMIQNILAFDGMRKRNLAKTEKTLTMMKIHFVLLAISHVNKALELIKLREDPELGKAVPHNASFVVAGVLSVVFDIILLIWPTTRVRNILKTIPKGYDHAVAEEIRKEQDQDIDPIERLGSLPFKIYKGGLVLLFCWIVGSSVLTMFEILAKPEVVWEEMMSKSSFLILTVSGFSGSIARIVFVFFVFEGMRRRDLDKVEFSVKIMKVWLGVELLLNMMKEIALYSEAKESQDIWVLILSTLFQQLMVGLMYYFMFLYGALKARDILRAHIKARRTL